MAKSSRRSSSNTRARGRGRGRAHPSHRASTTRRVHRRSHKRPIQSGG
jgi:hypothetical protein